MLSSEFDVVLAFITTKLFYEEESCIKISPSDRNGLKKESLIRLDKLVTLDQELIVGKLGEIKDSKILELNRKMKRVYNLD